ncbi:MAG: hypothetical protein K8W52_06670 [Deltaproteobacteria bacterium]|nr:hypothetical protein [Deltaproteobacteria bacterium]
MPGRRATKELATFGIPVAVLAANRTWTSFVPIDGASLDVRGAARILGAATITVYFDDDARTTSSARSACHASSRCQRLARACTSPTSPLAPP